LGSRSNPETWIPYELSVDSNVSVSIYDIRGRLVLEINLGHQSAGSYTTRDKATHWDGRNNNGETVASGIYFYQLTTDHFSSVRRMMLVK
jgi:flagellar hook assembly protein FlgD